MDRIQENHHFESLTCKKQVYLTQTSKINFNNYFPSSAFTKNQHPDKNSYFTKHKQIGYVCLVIADIFLTNPYLR